MIVTRTNSLWWWTQWNKHSDITRPEITQLLQMNLYYTIYYEYQDVQIK